MVKQRIAIIVGGIVGSTLAYFLSQGPRAQHLAVTMFDSGSGQATKAAAGIISPWLSKRRNQKWFALACAGAQVVNTVARQTLMDDATYRQSGTIITRSTADQVAELLAIAKARAAANPLMGTVEALTPAQINAMVPVLKNQLPGVWVPGGAWIDGAKYANHLRHIAQQVNLTVKKTPARLSAMANLARVNDAYFDQVFICSGAWMRQTLLPVGINLAIHPQKGQLIKVTLPSAQSGPTRMPVVMPEGERDFIPVDAKHVIIGATHENAAGFDLTVSPVVVSDLLASAQTLIAGLTESSIQSVRVGTRAYTTDSAPYCGPLPGFSNVWVGGGLGSSGLTTGPMVAQLLAQASAGHHPDWHRYSQPVAHYLK